MSDDLDALFARCASEEIRRKEESREFQENKEKWDKAVALLSQIRNPSSNPLAAELGRQPTQAEGHDWYAGMLIKYCRAVRDADPTCSLPKLTPDRDGERLAVEVLRSAWERDREAIRQILDRSFRTSSSLSREMITCLENLLHSLLGAQEVSMGSWYNDPAEGGSDQATEERAEEAGPINTDRPEMEDDLDSLLRRDNERRQDEQPRPDDFAAQKAIAADLLRQIEHPGHNPSDSEYADRLIRFCAAARAAGLSQNNEGLTPTGDGTRLALRLAQLAEKGDAAKIVQILSKMDGSYRLGALMVEALIDLFRRRLNPARSVYGEWAEKNGQTTLAAADSPDRTGAGHDAVEGAQEDAEGTGDQGQAVELPEREQEILGALQLLDAKTERRRVSRLQAARKADSHTAPSTYFHPIASLVKRGLIHCKKGPAGGIWLTSNGQAVGQSLSGDTHQ